MSFSEYPSGLARLDRYYKGRYFGRMNKGKINKREIMFDMIRKWQESGVSQASFCKEHQLAISTFTYWLLKFRKQENKNSYQEENPLYGARGEATRVFPKVVNSQLSTIHVP